MPAKTDYSRKSKYKTTEYHGERSVGGNLVYAGDTLLDKHLFVHRVADGGFDWGPDAADARACQLAIALLAPLKGVDEAVKTHHLFAENFVRRELTGDSWTIKRRDFRARLLSLRIESIISLIQISRHLLLSDGRLIRLRYETSVHPVHVD